MREPHIDLIGKSIGVRVCALFGWRARGSPSRSTNKTMSEAAAAAEWPGGLTLERVHEALEKLLGSESWETLTMKVILAKLEASLLPQHPPGTLKPFKKLIKEKVDTLIVIPTQNLFLIAKPETTFKEGRTTWTPARWPRQRKWC